MSLISEELLRVQGIFPDPGLPNTGAANEPETAQKGSQQTPADLLTWVIDHTPLIVWAVDPSGTITMSRGAGLKALGFADDQLIGKSVFDLYKDLPHALEPILQPLAGKAHSGTVKVGSLYFDSYTAPLYDAEGRLVQVRGLSMIVTERIRAERALHAVEDRFYKAFHSSPSAIAISRLSDGVYVDVNAAFIANTGYTRDELVGKTALSLGQWSDVEERAQLVRTLAQDGSVHGMECRFRAKSGELRMGRVSAEMIDLDDEPCILFNCEDITESKRIEQQLKHLNEELETRVTERTRQLHLSNRLLRKQIRRRQHILDALEESNEKWSTLVNNAVDIIFTISPDGTIQFINHTLAAYTVESVIGTSVYDYFPEADRETARRQFSSVFETGSAAVYETPAVDNDGRPHWFSCRIGPMKKGGEVVAAVVIATDITRRRIAEEIARQRKVELEHLSRLHTMGAMVATLAHELNNPLAAIANYAAGCARRLNTPGQIDPAALVEAAEGISAQADRASETIRRIRNFVKKREQVIEPIQPWEIVDEAIALVASEAARTNVKILAHSDGPLPTINVDKLQIQQVLLNLLVNGIESMVGGNDDARTLTVQARATGDGHVVIAVADQGCGLPDDFHDKIFEPFWTTKPHGLGMGLSISQSIVDSHGGKLQVVRNQLRGTTFLLELPCTRGQPRPNVTGGVVLAAPAR